MVKKTGVYQIRNKINGKIYVGSASFSIFDRWKRHLVSLKKGTNNQYLQNSYLKYGSSCFEFSVLEECKPEECIVKEQFWIDTLNPEYNILKVAGSWKGHRHKQHSIEKMRIGNLGKRASIETKKLLSSQRTGTKNPRFGLPKERHPYFNKKGNEHPSFGRPAWNRRRVICISNSMIFESVTMAGKALNIDPSSIVKNINGKYKSAGNKTFAYIDNVIDRTLNE